MSRKNKMKNKDFEKARTKKLIEGLVYFIIGLLLSLIAQHMYNIDIDFLLCLATGLSGVWAWITFIDRLIDYIDSIDNRKYSLCKRCKGLIKKDKLFCSSCKESIRISIKRDKDKKYFSEYKTLIKKEKNK